MAWRWRVVDTVTPSTPPRAERAGTPPRRHRRAVSTRSASTSPWSCARARATRIGVEVPPSVDSRASGCGRTTACVSVENQRRGARRRRRRGRESATAVDATLAQHRREGVSFVFECVHGMKKDRYGGTGAILADDMGLGKTLQSITLMYSLLKNKDSQGKPLAKRCIVVCPCSLVKNWEDEFENGSTPSTISASRRVEAPSLHSNESSPGMMEVGGFFFEFEAIRTASRDRDAPRRAHDKGERVECMALSDTSRKTVEGMIDQFLSPACYYDVLVISYETFRAQHQRFARKKDSCGHHRLRRSASFKK